MDPTSEPGGHEGHDLRVDGTAGEVLPRGPAIRRPRRLFRMIPAEAGAATPGAGA